MKPKLLILAALLLAFTVVPGDSDLVNTEGKVTFEGKVTLIGTPTSSFELLRENGASILRENGAVLEREH